jgi:hypothetical protein
MIGIVGGKPSATRREDAFLPNRSIPNTKTFKGDVGRGGRFGNMSRKVHGKRSQMWFTK